MKLSDRHQERNMPMEIFTMESSKQRKLTSNQKNRKTKYEYNVEMILLLQSAFDLKQQATINDSYK